MLGTFCASCTETDYFFKKSDMSCKIVSRNFLIFFSKVFHDFFAELRNFSHRFYYPYVFFLVSEKNCSKLVDRMTAALLIKLISEIWLFSG